MSRSDTLTVSLPLQEFTCPIIFDIPDEPVLSSCCGVIFELSGVITLRSCPWCRSVETTFSAASPVIVQILQHIRSATDGNDASVRLSINFPIDFIRSLIASGDQSRIVQNTIDEMLSQHPELYQYTSFNVDEFTEIVRKNELKTVAGERFITQLKNNAMHLNHAGVIAILTSTKDGLLILRQNLNVKTIDDEKKLFFGNALLSPEFLRIQVNDIDILDLLSREIAVDLSATEQHEMRLRQTIEVQYQLFIDALYERQLIEKESEEIFAMGLQTQFSRWLTQEEAQKTRWAIAAEARREFRLLLSLARKQGLFRNTVTAEVNDILQQVVYGQRIKVREMLERLKHETPALLQEVLTSVATMSIIDYSGKKIENLTLLQAAAAAGDVSLYPKLVARDRNHEGMCEIIQSYFPNNVDGQAEIASQLEHIFPNGIEANKLEQRRTAFNFDAIIAAISRASSADLDRAFNCDDARFDETDSAREKRDDDPTLTLTEALNRFREQFTKQSMGDDVFNPHHLLKAFALYKTMWNRCEHDRTDPHYEKRNLFLRQVIGFVQRFLPACYAQAFAQGLTTLVKVYRNASWRPEVLKCAFSTLHHHALFYPLSLSCSGLGFEFARGWITGSMTVGLDAPEHIFSLEKLCQAKTSGLERLCRGREFSHARMTAVGV